ncbi:MAG: histidine phosphatase family protein [Gammaproteobacteria bacterium]|nr:histidine phosphatase family protein [Gammaproteobacteria bacterium]
MAILLIRHGETALNAARIVQLPDTPLNERGKLQAGRLARRLADYDLAGIVSSDYARARMTAEAISAGCGLPITFRESLRERNFGDVRGKRHTELEYDLFALDFHPRGGESWEQFHARVARAWEDVLEIAEGIEGDLAVVTHALVCRSLATHHFEVPAELGADVPRWPNTALTVIDPLPPWRVSLLACDAHLDESCADDSAARS